MHTQNRRIFLSKLASIPLLTTGCLIDYGRFFDMEWDEEVELHNGRIIIIHIKRTFERVRSMRYSRWKGMEWATEIGFDAGGKIGYYKRRFEGYDINYIGYSHGNWYLSLAGLGRVLGRDGVRKIFKTHQPSTWIIFSDGRERAAKYWEEVPHFPVMNILRVIPDSEGVRHFNNKKVSIYAKKMHQRKFPYGGRGVGETHYVEGQPLPE